MKHTGMDNFSKPSHTILQLAVEDQMNVDVCVCGVSGLSDYTSSYQSEMLGYSASECSTSYYNVITTTKSVL